MCFTQLVKPFGDNPSERFADSCLRKILLNRTVPRTVRPFQGSHGPCWLQHTLQETYASPERARGTAKRWRGAPPAPTLWIAVVTVSSSVLRERQLQPLPGFPPKDGGELGEDVENFIRVKEATPSACEKRSGVAMLLFILVCTLKRLTNNFTYVRCVLFYVFMDSFFISIQ